MSWSRAGQPPEVIPTGAVQPTDTDNDGIVDTWELAHGLNAFDSTDASLVPDGDNLTNLAKYQLGLSLGQRVDRVSGGAIMEEWRNLTGGTVADLTNSPRFPSAPDSRTLLTSLETITNHADNYGERIRGYLVPPADGSYQFWIAADDRAELWLSPTDSPFDRIKIASVVSATALRAYDVKSMQKSVPLTLQAGRYSYFEVLQKEGSGSDHLSVAWTRPGALREVINGRYLATFAPRADNVSGDGLPDPWKTANGLDLTQGYGLNGAYSDPDADGLVNLAEYQAHTNPKLADSDQDSFLDQQELVLGFDPIDPMSHPLGIAPWVYTDIGLVTTGGGSAIDTHKPGYLLTGNGGGINGASGLALGSDDAFRFIYQTVTGDFDFSARVTRVDQFPGTAALVVRDGLSSVTPSAAISVDNTDEFCFQVRPDALSGTIILKKAYAPELRWQQLQRKGQVVNSYYSADGQYWTLYYPATVNLPVSCEIGMGVWNSSTATTQDFSQVQLQVGASDSPTQTNGLDPLIPSLVRQTIATYTGASGSATLGSWKKSGDTAISQTVKAALDFTFQIPADGAYLLEFEAQSGGNDTINVAFPVKVSIDGQFIDLVDLLLPPGQVGLARVGTPWLKAGTHHAVFLYDNTQSYRYLQVNALRLQTLGAPMPTIMVSRYALDSPDLCRQREGTWPTTPRM